jgi:uncharacterized protein YjbI with pentapeptide repeats
MPKELLKDYRIDKSLKNERYKDIIFEELRVYASNIRDCEFLNVHFKHSSLGSNTKYQNCKFSNCKFEGQYCTLGNPSTYKDCIFEDCTFNGRMIFMGAIFEVCKFSGTLKNNVLIDEKKWFSRPFKFTNCDFSAAEFSNLTFNGDRLFNNCRMPIKGQEELH